MDYNIKQYGAIADAKTINTFAIQRTIDKCSADGGGRVIVSGGTYMTGTIILKENVNLHFESDGKLLCSPFCGKYVNGSDLNGNYDLVAETEEYGDYPNFEKNM